MPLLYPHLSFIKFAEIATTDILVLALHFPAYQRTPSWITLCLIIVNCIISPNFAFLAHSCNRTYRYLSIFVYAVPTDSKLQNVSLPRMWENWTLWWSNLHTSNLKYQIHKCITNYTTFSVRGVTIVHSFSLATPLNWSLYPAVLWWMSHNMKELGGHRDESISNFG